VQQLILKGTFLMNKQQESYNKMDADKLIATALQCLEDRMTYITGQTLNGSKMVRDYLRLQLADEKNEVFGAIFLTQRHKLIAFEKMFYGTINEAVVYPRSVVQKALEHNAAAIIIAHNHPSGVALPSGADERVTKDLKQVLSIISIKLIDHVIVTHKDTYSFAESGLI
jgi:DNA repair protein RadC